jgi:hypothetical protein
VEGIFIIARGDESTGARLIANGAVDCLVKPLTEARLIYVLNDALMRGRQGDPRRERRGLHPRLKELPGSWMLQGCPRQLHSHGAPSAKFADHQRNLLPNVTQPGVLMRHYSRPLFRNGFGLLAIPCDQGSGDGNAVL